MNKDIQCILEAYNKVLDEQGHEGNIADNLHNLLSSIDQEAKTRTGASVRESLHDIIIALGEAVDVALKYADAEPWEALQDLLSKLRLD